MESVRPWSERHKRLFKILVLAAGLSEKLVFHGLRHTYASELVRAETL